MGNQPGLEEKVSTDVVGRLVLLNRYRENSSFPVAGYVHKLTETTITIAPHPPEFLRECVAAFGTTRSAAHTYQLRDFDRCEIII